MKKVFMAVAMAAALATTQIASAKEVEIKDMGQSNWAYKAVQKMVQRGYLALYEDETFRGSLPVSREVFAAALSKLIDQIESGEIGAGSGDAGDLRKSLNEFKKEISDYESRTKVVGDRIAEIERGHSITDKSLTDTVVDTRKGFDQAASERERLSRDLGILNDDLKTLNAELEKERKARKSAQTMAWIGILGAVVIGAASN